MHLPKLITELVAAQNNHDAVAYSSLFTANAHVFDEGKNHVGRDAIQQWFSEANKNYQTTLKPISYLEANGAAIFKAEISGTFPGSPAIINFNLVFQQDLIHSLKITG